MCVCVCVMCVVLGVCGVSGVCVSCVVGGAGVVCGASEPFLRLIRPGDGVPPVFVSG